MMNIKKILKRIGILVLLAVLLLIGIVLIDKVLSNLKEKYNDNGKSNSNKSNSLLSSNGTINKDSSGSNEKGDTDSNVTNSNGSKNNDGLNSGTSGNSNYEPFYFDDTLLFFEGEQNGKEIRKMIDRLIENTNQQLFSYVDVTIKNFGNLDKTITFSSKEEYVSSLLEVKNQINESSNYNVSFGYSKLHAYVNEIIVESK